MKMHFKICSALLLFVIFKSSAIEALQAREGPAQSELAMTQVNATSYNTEPLEFLTSTALPLDRPVTTEIRLIEDNNSSPKIEPNDQNSRQATLRNPIHSLDHQQYNNATLGLEESGKKTVLSLCSPELLSFELITGYVLSAPGKLMDSLPGTLMITDCLDACKKNATCHAINFETGLCVLFSVNADDLPGSLTKSQFPVFTIYAQKTCLSKRSCERSWFADRVQNLRLIGFTKKPVPATSRIECMEQCMAEKSFKCRSANYNGNAKTCELSEMDRFTLAGRKGVFQIQSKIDYLENNCVEEPNRLCEFKRLSARILKTVDSVYQNVASIEECRDLCLASQYRCHSYDYGDTGDSVCRLSHHSSSTLFDVQDPYLPIHEATTYELAYCYNVSVECGSGHMITRVRTSKLFDGKLYAKGSPKSCAVDVKNSLEFELRMRYQDIECNVHQSADYGRFSNDVVIQHHDMIVTSSDLALAVACQYELTNKSITTDFDLLSVRGDIIPELTEEVIVESPNVLMKITSRDGVEVMRSAQVGDPLALAFEIVDKDSPYEIFVRELVAMDGSNNGEITLIDSNGCPTDELIMGPVLKSTPTGKVLLSEFDAFKFPSSEVVQFRALVTPCMPKCDPIRCDRNDEHGTLKTEDFLSFGRKRRSVEKRIRTRRESSAGTSHDKMLLVESIKITDKFTFDKQQSPKSTVFGESETEFQANDINGFCVNAVGLLAAGVVFITTQLMVIVVWTYIYQKHRKQRFYDSQNLNSSHFHSIPPSRSIISGNSSSPPSEALNHLYDCGMTSRFGS